MRIASTAGTAFALVALSAAFAAAQQAAPSKAQKPPAPPTAPAAASQPAPAAKPEVKVVKFDAVHAMVLPMKGSYMQHPDAFGQVTVGLAKLGVAATGPMFARYFSQPGIAEEEQTWEVGFPVPASVTKVDAPFEIQEIPASKMAVRMHTGPMEELGSAWPAFVGEVMAAGYMISGSPVQIFGDGGLEMRLPVQ
jgi:effector-binding domain-containing protein